MLRLGETVHWVDDPHVTGVVKEVDAFGARVLWADDTRSAHGLWYNYEELRLAERGKRSSSQRAPRRGASPSLAPEIQDLEFITKLHEDTHGVVMERDAGYRGDDDPGPIIEGPAHIYDLYSGMRMLDQEHFVVGALDVRGSLIGWKVCHKGAIDNVQASAKDILKDALACAVVRCIYVIHNHPSGNADPSDADSELTEAVELLANEFEICLFDHVVIGRSGLDPDTRRKRKPYFSFRQAGLLAPIEDPEDAD